MITVTATLDRSARTEDTPVQIVLSDSGLAEAVDYSAVREFGLTIPKDQLNRRPRRLRCGAPPTCLLCLRPCSF